MDTANVKQGTSWLTEAGLRPTRQRLALANLLVGDGHHRHVTAESLYSAVKKSDENVSLATIYNTLKVFTEAGLIWEILVDGTKSYFDTRIDDHPHFYWEDESILTDAPNNELEITKLPNAPIGTKVSKVVVVIRLRKSQI